MSVPTVFLIASDSLGSGDGELGRALMLSALKTLAKGEGGASSRILFMNAGVKLCCDGSAALGDLRLLADAGAELLCCGTCLDWFELDESLVVGSRSNMAEILGSLKAAERAISL